MRACGFWILEASVLSILPLRSSSMSWWMPALWKPSAFTSSYRALLSRRGLTGPNFHALRHSHASQMLSGGVDIKTVSARLGHSRASFTLQQYCHLLPGTDQEAARRVDVVLRKAIEQTRQSKIM